MMPMMTSSSMRVKAVHLLHPLPVPWERAGVRALRASPAPLQSRRALPLPSPRLLGEGERQSALRRHIAERRDVIIGSIDTIRAGADQDISIFGARGVGNRRIQKVWVGV